MIIAKAANVDCFGAVIFDDANGDVLEVIFN